jgi:ABC-type bacteriocin/lantibiotic exporter with double-glycine peptidase domain
MFWWMAIGNYWIYWVFQWLLLSYFRGYWFKKECFVMKTGQLIDAKLILGYYKHLLHLPQRFWHHANRKLLQNKWCGKIRSFINEVAIDRQCVYSYFLLRINVYVLLETGFSDFTGDSVLRFDLFYFE